MEILLALAVVTAVIIFGALISLGNERQRRAIDELREQTVLWAIQDLHIKRERMARDVRVDDPKNWMSKVVSKITGLNEGVVIIETFQSPQAIVCESEVRNFKVILTPCSPADLQRLKKKQGNKLSRFNNSNPLVSLSSRSKPRECNVLNSGMLFDLELAMAWKQLTGQDVEGTSLWVYFIE